VGREDAGAAAGQRAITQLCAHGLAPLELLTAVAQRVRQVVPYAAAGWQMIDPATLLPTGGFAQNVDPATHLQLIDNELTGGDFVAFTAVGRSRTPVATLRQATAGRLTRSTRYRTINAAAGWSDELRTVFRTGATCWGQGCLARAEGEPAFSARDAAFLAAIAPSLGAGLRHGLVLDHARSSEPDADAPGLVVLQDDGSVEAISDSALDWLGRLPDEGLNLPSVVYEVARRARLHADTGNPGPLARARVRLPSGAWVAVSGSRLHPVGPGAPRTVVVLEPAKPADLAPLIVQAYQLSPRERQITEMLVRGLPLTQIAATLWLSQHTIRDHIKAIYAKLGVRSRPELTAMLFHEHYA
jgi:DNA-binding CsgD family transcriptional regulator